MISDCDFLAITAEIYIAMLDRKIGISFPDRDMTWRTRSILGFRSESLNPHTVDLASEACFSCQMKRGKCFHVASFDGIIRDVPRKR